MSAPINEVPVSQPSEKSAGQRAKRLCKSWHSLYKNTLQQVLCLPKQTADQCQVVGFSVSLLDWLSLNVQGKNQIWEWGLCLFQITNFWTESCMANIFGLKMVTLVSGPKVLSDIVFAASLSYSWWKCQLRSPVFLYLPPFFKPLLCKALQSIFQPNPILEEFSAILKWLFVARAVLHWWVLCHWCHKRKCLIVKLRHTHWTR